MSEKLISRQKEFMAHLLRANKGDFIKTCTINRNGSRIFAGFQRTGRLRIKWYGQVMNACFNKTRFDGPVIAKLERGCPN